MRRLVLLRERQLSKRQPPALVYVPTPCPQCGAVTEKDAETMCKQTCDETGEYSCEGEFQDGISVQPTPESLKAWDNFFCAASSGI